MASTATGLWGSLKAAAADLVAEEGADESAGSRGGGSIGGAANSYSERQPSGIAPSSSRGDDLSDILGQSNDDGLSDLMGRGKFDDRRGVSSSSSHRGDPNGMEQLKGESDEEYTARQKKLFGATRERMRAKFGSASSIMGGVGNDPNYKPVGGRGDSSSLSSPASSAPPLVGVSVAPAPTLSLPSRPQASTARKPTSPIPKVASGDEFFASFGAN